LKINILRRAIQDPKIILWGLASRGYLNFIPDSIYIKIAYRLILGKPLNLKNPQTFNEKLQWLKIYDKNPVYTMLADKYEVRKYIEKTIGENYLIPLLGVYDSFSEINFDKLPDKFVIKCTHDSGSIVICKDKSSFNIKEAKKRINNCLKRNYYNCWREWPYKNIKPRIICEQYMVDESGTELKDYKILCFNGEPKVVQVDSNRFSGHIRNLYDTEWNFIPTSETYPAYQDAVKKPLNLQSVLDVARVLSKDYPHVRVDFYIKNEKIYFGELTFYYGSGFEAFTTEQYDYLLGSWIEIPPKRRMPKC